MSVWDLYEQRMTVHGTTKRQAALTRETRYIYHHLPDNLSYTEVEMWEQEHTCNIDSDEAQEYLIRQRVAVIDSDNLNEKTIISMPHDDLPLGALVHWMDQYWILTERDANTTVYTRGKLLQCNHLLHWIVLDKDSHEPQIMSQWCVVDDGTKYMSGETEDRDFITTRGDSRISVTISRNEYTLALDRTCRFLIDDPDSPHKLAYTLSKPLKLGHTYNNQGYLLFVLQEVTASGDDNHELGIAEYYKYFPFPEDTDDEDEDADTEEDDSTEDEETTATTTSEKTRWL